MPTSNTIDWIVAQLEALLATTPAMVAAAQAQAAQPARPLYEAPDADRRWFSSLEPYYQRLHTASLMFAQWQVAAEPVPAAVQTRLDQLLAYLADWPAPSASGFSNIIAVLRTPWAHTQGFWPRAVALGFTPVLANHLHGVKPLMSLIQAQPYPDTVVSVDMVVAFAECYAHRVALTREEQLGHLYVGVAATDNSLSFPNKEAEFVYALLETQTMRFYHAGVPVNIAGRYQAYCRRQPLAWQVAHWLLHRAHTGRWSGTPALRGLSTQFPEISRETLVRIRQQVTLWRSLWPQPPKQLPPEAGLVLENLLLSGLSPPTPSMPPSDLDLVL